MITYCRFSKGLSLKYLQVNTTPPRHVFSFEGWASFAICLQKITSYREGRQNALVYALPENWPKSIGWKYRDIVCEINFTHSEVPKIIKPGIVLLLYHSIS